MELLEDLNNEKTMKESDIHELLCERLDDKHFFMGSIEQSLLSVNRYISRLEKDKSHLSIELLEEKKKSKEFQDALVRSMLEKDKIIMDLQSRISKLISL